MKSWRKKKRQRFSKEGLKKQRGEKTLEKSYPRGKEKNGEKRRNKKNTENAEMKADPGSYKVKATTSKSERERKTIPLRLVRRKARAFAEKKNTRIASCRRELWEDEQWKRMRMKQCLERAFSKVVSRRTHCTHGQLGQHNISYSVFWTTFSASSHGVRYGGASPLMFLASWLDRRSANGREGAPMFTSFQVLTDGAERKCPSS